jgi:hypothetical protein
MTDHSSQFCRCIEQISNFIGPILQGLNIYTGLHATLIVGGPMPTLGGELGTLQYVSHRSAIAELTPRL